MKQQKICLGDRAQDKITGFNGIVVADMEWLYGCRRLTLQPEALKDGKPQERESFDEPQLFVGQAAVHPITDPSFDASAVNLGDRVVDIMTGVGGIVCTITTWIHGCVFVTVQPEGSKEMKPHDLTTFDLQRLKVAKKGAVVFNEASPAKKSYGPRDDSRALNRG